MALLVWRRLHKEWVFGSEQSHEQFCCFLVGPVDDLKSSDDLIQSNRSALADHLSGSVEHWQET